MIECTDDRASLGNAYIAVDWDPTALHLRYQTSQERVKTHAHTHAHMCVWDVGICLDKEFISFRCLKHIVTDDHFKHTVAL